MPSHTHIPPRTTILAPDAPLDDCEACVTIEHAANQGRGTPWPVISEALRDWCLILDVPLLISN